MRDKLGRFLKGHNNPNYNGSWNKGLKGYTNSGSFKKGQHKGSKNQNWKNGKRIQQGYIYILQPAHPRATKAGYIKRSHLIMEKKIGRFIKPLEIVHHINGIKDDDRLENLQLFSNRNKHNKIHPRKRNALGRYL